MNDQTTKLIPTQQDSKAVQPAPSRGETTMEPTLIIVFGWMGARMSHLRKFGQAYEKIYPSSAQILVNADPWWFWKSQVARERSMEPVIEKLKDLGMLQAYPGSAAVSPRILLHVMSNGGACSVVDLASALSVYPSHVSADARSAIVFDSAPGGGTFLTANRSFTAAIRNPIVKIFALSAVSFVYVVMLLYRIVLRKPHPYKKMLADLNKPDLLPWTSLKTPRVYIYSSSDKIVEERVVEEHAAKARSMGFPVRLEHFGKSGHVAHMKDDPERYWSTIQSLWSDTARQ